MTILLSNLWFFLLLAAFFGVIIARVTRLRPHVPGDGPQGVILTGLFVLALVVALSRIVAGRTGLALEIGLVLLAAYLVGASLTTLIHRSSDA